MLEYMPMGFDSKRTGGDAWKGEERREKGGCEGEEILKPSSEQPNAQQMPV